MEPEGFIMKYVGSPAKPLISLLLVQGYQAQSIHLKWETASIKNKFSSLRDLFLRDLLVTFRLITSLVNLPNFWCYFFPRTLQSLLLYWT